MKLLFLLVIPHYSHSTKSLLSIQSNFISWNVNRVEKPLNSVRNSENYEDSSFFNKIIDYREQSKEKIVDFLNLRGGHQQNAIENTLRKLSITGVCIATAQSFSKLIIKFQILELATKLLSEETAKALTQIQLILSKFDTEHGVIDIFSRYPTKDVLLSIYALSKLQRAALRFEESESSEVVEVETVWPQELLSDLAHYAAYANAAYGWKGSLAMSGRIHMGNLGALVEKTGVEKEDLVEAQWSAKTHRPAYFIVRDNERRKIVLCIRGTLSPRDILTDLCCTAEEFLTRDEDSSSANDVDDFKKTVSTKYRARAHQGMLEAARGVSLDARQTISSELASHPDYDLVIVGHSLGGGTAAVLGTMWQETFPGLSVYAYGCPCVGPLNSNPTLSSFIYSIVGEGDPFATLSLGHLADNSIALSHLCENKMLRGEIIERVKGSAIDDLDPETQRWCAKQMKKIRKSMRTEKFYPPGQILYLSSNAQGPVIKAVNQERFRDLVLKVNMFDLTRHIPGRYEGELKKILEFMNNSPY